MPIPTPIRSESLRIPFSRQTLCSIDLLSHLSRGSYRRVIDCRRPLARLHHRAAPKRRVTVIGSRLFNGKDLSGWHVVLTPDLKGIDPDKVFQVHDGVIHAYRDVPQGAKVPIGYLASDDNYSWYHLKLEYRWVGKRFAPRVDRPRDAGVLYHAGAEQKVWPRCIECQIQEGDVGDCFTVNGVQVESTFDPQRLKSGVHQVFAREDGGVIGVWGGPRISRIVKSSTHEVDGWNTVEVIVRGDEEAIHKINGHEVFRAKKLQQLDSDQKSWIPLTLRPRAVARRICGSDVSQCANQASGRWTVSSAESSGFNRGETRQLAQRAAVRRRFHA